jgi:polar amino acid transport system substrate-binding protein
LKSIAARISKVVVFLLFVYVNSACCEESSFFVADDIDAAPYIFANSEKRPDGIFYDINEKAFRRMGIPLKYKVFPWKRAQMLVETKQADALITIPTSTRLKYLVPSREPVFVMKYKIFTQRDNPNIEKIKSIRSLSDLKGLKIIDYIGDGWAEKNLTQYGVEWAPNLTSACKMIASHRGDIFLQDEIMVLYAIKNIRKNIEKSDLDYDHIVSFDAPIPHVGFHLLIRKDSQYLKLIPKFDETIRSMHEDGEIEKIKNKWINSDS